MAARLRFGSDCETPASPRQPESAPSYRLRVTTLQAWRVPGKAMQQSVIEAGQFEDGALQAGLERLVGVNRNDNQRAFAGFAIDVMAAFDALELPAVLLQPATEFLAGITLHTATSRIWTSGSGCRPSACNVSK